jgi:hypothetical protein
VVHPVYTHSCYSSRNRGCHGPSLTISGVTMARHAERIAQEAGWWGPPLYHLQLLSPLKFLGSASRRDLFLTIVEEVRQSYARKGKHLSAEGSRAAKRSALKRELFFVAALMLRSSLRQCGTCSSPTSTARLKVDALTPRVAPDGSFDVPRASNRSARERPLRKAKRTSHLSPATSLSPVLRSWPLAFGLVWPIANCQLLI